MGSTADRKNVIVEKRGMVGWITFNRPDRYNTCDHEMYSDIFDGLQSMSSDPGVGVIVITGAGDKSFCAGGFLGDLTHFSRHEGRLHFTMAQEVMNAIRRAPQPVIAAVNGVAVGGGNEFVICCDLAIASDKARFGQAGTRVGSSPVFGANNLFSIQVGEKKAKEVTFLSRLYSAEEALKHGWINKVVPHERLYEETQAWCEELLDKSPAYLELTKITSNVWWEMLQPGMEHAKQTLMALAGGPEMTEGASAFMQKRKANWRQFRK
jgi:2-ketocyclohexanecarboxyl-CoA hydrolase